MPGSPCCELFLILYYTPYSTKLKVNKTDAVSVCLFRIFTFEQIILNPVTVAKHWVALTVLEYSCVVIFKKVLRTGLATPIEVVIIKVAVISCIKFP